ERLAGAPATFLSDLYAMGVVLYEALSGEKPFSGTTFVDVARAVASGMHQPLGQRRPDLDPAVVAAVGPALGPGPTQRFASGDPAAPGDGHRQEPQSARSLGVDDHPAGGGGADDSAAHDGGRPGHGEGDRASARPAQGPQGPPRGLAAQALLFLRR